jgi:hypothetical protein
LPQKAEVILGFLKLSWKANMIQGGKFVGCAEDLRRGKFINLLHFGAELWENELVWRTGVQKFI